MLFGIREPQQARYSMKRVGIHLFGLAWLVILGPVSSAVADPTKLPCDRYADDNGPCVAAHSTVRLLRSAYSGPLYQVRREGRNGGKTKDIGVAAGGFADAAAQDAFCGTRRCTISKIYDQSGRGNDLSKEGAIGDSPSPDLEANAKGAPITISGHNLWGENNVPGVGYRKSKGNGTATFDSPETIYMVASGTFSNERCCFEYGNVGNNGSFDSEGQQEAIYFGSFSLDNQGAGKGPWVMADLGGVTNLKYNMWAGSRSPFQGDPSITSAFVTAMIKGGNSGSKRLVVKVGDAQSGKLTTVFNDQRPWEQYSVMQKGGEIVLGTDGVNNNAGQGNFYEGVMTAHCSSDSADDDVQANIVSVYGH